MPNPLSLPDYHRLMLGLQALPVLEFEQRMRELCRTDLYFLLRYVLNRPDVEHPWIFARCQEVQDHPDGFGDFWARGHYKSTIITFAKTIQDILASHGDSPLPHWSGIEPTFAIFSHTRPIAKGFLQQIKREFETNEVLQDLFPDVLYRNPGKQAPKWSEDEGLIVRRRSNPKESTIEAWGLVDGQPTSRHYNVMIYDDVVVLASVNTPDMIKKTTTAWEQSLNLGTSKGYTRHRYIGTRYHFADTYRAMMDRKAFRMRIHTATDDGTLKGKPILMSPQDFENKVREMGIYTASAQLLMNPIADSKQTFLREWFNHRFDREVVGWRAMNRALIVDPASGRKAKDAGPDNKDYTAIAVVGKGPDGNRYLLDLIRDRLSLKQRADEVIRLHRKWQPMVTGYEEYGMQADIEYLHERMAYETYHFEVQPLGGSMKKFDRVNRLIPICSEGKYWFPEVIYRTNCDGKLEDLMDVLIEQEALAWPVPLHDDALDAMSREFDLEGFPFPRAAIAEHRDDRFNRRRNTGRSWMSH